MGLTKTEAFSKAQNELAAFAKALGHPARIAIVQFLIQTKSCVCGDIVDELPLSQSTISQHLKELKRVGIIQGDIEGPTVCYCIDPRVWARVKRTMNALFDSYDDPRCC